VCNREHTFVLPMALIESLLTAIVRADGDALVMHVGEKPYVVASAGPIELSSQGLNLQAMAGMVAQLLPAELQRALTEFGAVEHELPPTSAAHGDRFTVVVARGGDDVWIEIRRHRRSRDASAEPTNPVAVQHPVEPEHPVEMPHVVETRDSVEPIGAEAPVLEPAGEIDETAPTLASASGTALLERLAEEPAAFEPAASVEPEAAVETPAPIAAADDADAPADVEAVSSEAPAHHGVIVPEAAFAADSMLASDSRFETEVPPVVESVGEPEAVAAVEFAAAAEQSPALQPQPLLEPARARAPVTEMHVEIPIPPTPDREAAVAPPAPSSASVIPMTRTLRIEVPRPPSRQPAVRSEIGRLLGLAAARGATALYLTTQASPFLRVDDDVQVLDGEPPMTSAEVESAVLELMPDTTRDALRRGDPTEWVCDIAEIGRVRCSTFRDYRGPGAIFQLNSFRPVNADQLGLAAEIQALAGETEGLVLVASPRGHGKSTLIGALVDLINHQRTGYVITLERQIRLVHEHDQALISQREVRGTADQVLNVARAALSENADVLVLDDLLSPEVFQLALDAAGSGRLVIASLTAPSVTAALTRVVELFPADQRKETLLLLAERLRGAVAQVLLRKTVGGRVAAREVVLATSAVGRVLVDGQLHDLPQAIDGGRKYGLVSLTDSLVQLVRSGAIDAREAYRKADDRQALLLALKRENVDTSVVERLA
jgi:twitching motility protein PilT